MGGVEAITRLRRCGAAARVLVLTTYDTDSDVLPAIEAGATGYLLKDAPRGRAVPGGPGRRARRAGARAVGGDPADGPVRRAGRQEALTPASWRCSAGRPRRDQPGGGPAAVRQRGHVKTHLLHIYAKLGVNDRAAAVSEAYQRGLIS